MSSLAAWVGLRFSPKAWAGGMEQPGGRMGAGGAEGMMGGRGNGAGRGMGGNGGGGGGGGGGRRGGGMSVPLPPVIPAPNAKVGLTTGDSRADETFRAMGFFKDELIKSIGSKRIVIKPNILLTNNQLCATHVDTIEGILDFLKSINKLENVVIAESTMSGRVTEGYDNYGYTKLAEKYNVKLLDLDEQPFEYVYVMDETDLRPKPVQVSKLLLDGGDNFVISASRMKTHDRCVVTLSLKNIVLGAPIKAVGGGMQNSNKPIVHGNGIYGINFNLFNLAARLKPHFALIEGHTGMEGNGPMSGTAVDHKVCVASTDWLAADRVGVELMGVDFAKVGYLTFASEAQLGQADLAKIEVLGEKIENHKKTYQLSRNIEQQYSWMTAPVRA